MPRGVRLAALAVVLLVVAQAGCRSRQLANDQDQFRHALLGMYENQIMDNLIRAQNGLPFIQLDYTNITGTITDTGSGNIGFAPGSTDTHVVDLIAKARSLTHTFTNTGTYGASGSRMSQLTVTANPVLDSAEVYNAYLAFLDKTGGLIRSCDPPPPGSAHMIRRCDGVYYWVPAQFRRRVPRPRPEDHGPPRPTAASTHGLQDDDRRRAGSMPTWKTRHCPRSTV